jgi:acetoacetyl-CoA synthetase
MLETQSSSTSNLRAFARAAGRGEHSYAELHAWSVADLTGFWDALNDWFGLGLSGPVAAAGSLERWPDELPARWWPEARLNYARRALRSTGPEPAIVALSQTRAPLTLSWDELADQVARCRAGLERLGVRTGDVVAGYLPVIPETTVAFLATVSLGAVWVCCPPEFGSRAVADRLSQVRPKVLLAVDGYRYGDKQVDRRADVSALGASLQSVSSVVRIGYLDDGEGDWHALLGGGDAAPDFVDVPFDHPLYVLFSSGTTGRPKAIVHGHGGILVEHLKALSLQHDLGPGDRMLWFTTTGWMMWNYLQSALLVGATLVLFDGDPSHPEPCALWDAAAETETTFFGTSPGYLRRSRLAARQPQPAPGGRRIAAIGVTGAPLDADDARWAAGALNARVEPISGGTDVATAFVGPAPGVTAPPGWNAAPFLGVAVEARTPSGRPVRDALGELVVTRPMPSMPVAYWNDASGARYRAAYFEGLEGVWTHGDWVEIASDGTSRITGRSDATLNRGGTRLGTSEFYSAVEQHREIADALVVHLEHSDELLLFVALTPDAQDLGPDLQDRIRRTLRSELSPRHVPDDIRQVRAIPRTLSGKRLEVPVKRVLMGAEPATAASADSLVDPDAFADFVTLADELARRTA